MPRDLQAGQVLRYTLEREVDGQTVLFWADITLAPRTVADLGRAAAAWIAERPEITIVPALSFVVALAVFLLRPGSPAARYMLLMFSYYGPGSVVAGLDGGLYTTIQPLPQVLAHRVGANGWVTVFFPSLTLLALSLPVRKWPLSRFPRLLPTLLYGVPIALTAPAVYWQAATGDPGVLHDLPSLLSVPIVLLFLGTARRQC